MNSHTVTWPPVITLVTWSEVGVKSNRGWADLLAADSGSRVEIVVEPDLKKRFYGVSRGTYDLVVGYSNESSLMLTADKGFSGDGPFAAGIVWAYNKSNSGFFARGDTQIFTPADVVPGTRIVDVSSFLGTRLYEALLAWAGVSHADIDWVPAHSTTEIVAKVSGGEADLAFAIPTSPTARGAAEGPRGIHWIDLNSAADPEGAARFREVYPLVHFGVMGDDGVASAAGRWGTEGINYFLAAAEMDTGLAAGLARWFDRNRERYLKTHRDNRFRTREVLLKGLGHTFIPCHPGLIDYLGETRNWTAAHRSRQAENLELADAYRRAFAEALAAAARAGIGASVSNSVWMEFWAGWKHEHDLPRIHVFDGLTSG